MFRTIFQWFLKKPRPTCISFRESKPNISPVHTENFTIWLNKLAVQSCTGKRYLKHFLEYCPRCTVLEDLHCRLLWIWRNALTHVHCAPLTGIIGGKGSEGISWYWSNSLSDWQQGYMHTNNLKRYFQIIIIMVAFHCNTLVAIMAAIVIV